MKAFLLVLFFLPALSNAQTLVAKASDGASWLIYVDTIQVGDAQQTRDRLVSALVEKRDESGRSVRRARQYTTGCYTHGDGRTRWGETGQAEEWTWGGPLVLDIVATRSCQYAWDRVEPDAGIEFSLKQAVSHRASAAGANDSARGDVGL